jgi:hypothetical protein
MLLRACVSGHETERVLVFPSAGMPRMASSFSPASASNKPGLLPIGGVEKGFSESVQTLSHFGQAIHSSLAACSGIWPLLAERSLPNEVPLRSGPLRVVCEQFESGLRAVLE